VDPKEKTVEVQETGEKGKQPGGEALALKGKVFARGYRGIGKKKKKISVTGTRRERSPEERIGRKDCVGQNPCWGQRLGRKRKGKKRENGRKKWTNSLIMRDQRCKGGSLRMRRRSFSQR